MKQEIVKVCKVHGELTKDECYSVYFKYFNCKKCRKKLAEDYRLRNLENVKFRERKKYYSDIQKSKLDNKRWRTSNVEKLRNKDTESRIAISSKYVKSLLRDRGFLTKEVSEDLEDVQRSIIKLKRKIKEIQNEKKHIG